MKHRGFCKGLVVEVPPAPKGVASARGGGVLWVRRLFTNNWPKHCRFTNVQFSELHNLWRGRELEAKCLANPQKHGPMGFPWLHVVGSQVWVPEKRASWRTHGTVLRWNFGPPFVFAQFYWQLLPMPKSDRTILCDPGRVTHNTSRHQERCRKILSGVGKETRTLAASEKVPRHASDVGRYG